MRNDEISYELDGFPAVIVTHKASGIVVRVESGESAMRNVQIAMDDIEKLLARMNPSIKPIGQANDLPAPSSSSKKKPKSTRKGK